MADGMPGTISLYFLCLWALVGFAVGAGWTCGAWLVTWLIGKVTR